MELRRRRVAIPAHEEDCGWQVAKTYLKEQFTGPPDVMRQLGYGLFFGRKWVRHPAYTGDMLFHFGVALLFSSLRGLAIMLALIPCFLYRIAVEERMLISRFGDSYRTYRQHTWQRLSPLL